jgi:hypothetical protein
MQTIKWFLLLMTTFILVNCGGGGGGGGGGSDNATTTVGDNNDGNGADGGGTGDDGSTTGGDASGGADGGGASETTSTLVSDSTLQIQTDLAALSGVSASQAKSISETASEQLSSDGLSNSSDASEVLPSLLSGTIKGIGANLTGETLVNNAISQSIATVMTLLGESELTASASTGRSAALTASMQSLLEKLVETAITGLEGLNLNTTALQQGLGNVVNAVVTNLGKAKVSASDIGEAVQSVGKSATNSLTKLSVSDTTKQSLKSQVETTMETSIEDLASTEPSLVTDVDSLKQSATQGMEEGAAGLKDPDTLEEAVFGTSQFGSAKFGK